MANVGTSGITSGLAANPHIRPSVVRIVAELSPGLRLTASTLSNGEIAAVLHAHGWNSWDDVMRTLS